MVVIKEVSAKAVSDSRKEKTISVSIKTDFGKFESSAPNGKSTGKFEAKSYKKDLEGDIRALKTLSDYFSQEIIDDFDDLRRIEDIVEGHVGANTCFALESAILKALAKEKKKEIWELINPEAKNLPRLVGNCIGGGKHSKDINGKKPTFQEFLLISSEKEEIKDSFEKNKKAKEEAFNLLKELDEKFKGTKNDEDAWQTSFNEKEVLEVIKELKDTKTKDFSKIEIGLDVAASSFYKRKNYHYENPIFKRDEEEQLNYLLNLINNFGIYYVEDPFGEEEFESFAKLLESTKKNKKSVLIVGDDLTVTNSKRLEKAIKEKAINGIIVKPNQCGSLIEVKKVCELAKKNKIKIIFSHRSGETTENILADLAFGFQADFIKCGITGKEREVKIKRLIEIEKTLNS